MEPGSGLPQRRAGGGGLDLGAGSAAGSPALSGGQSRRRKQPPRPADFKLQVIIIGSRGVGKTSLMERFTDDTFCEACKSTVGKRARPGPGSPRCSPVLQGPALGGSVRPPFPGPVPPFPQRGPAPRSFLPSHTWARSPGIPSLPELALVPVPSRPGAPRVGSRAVGSSGARLVPDFTALLGKTVDVLVSSASSGKLLAVLCQPC